MIVPAIAQVPGPFALSTVRQMVPLNPGSVYLFQGESEILHSAVQEIIDRLAIRGPVRVVVGGNRISFDRLPLILGAQVGNVYEIMDRILVSRAETCYQMHDVLTALESSPMPLVITDLLESFYEEDLAMPEVALLLQKCLTHIYRLSETAAILISANRDPARPKLIESLQQHSDQRFYFQPFPPEEEAQSAFQGF